MWNKKNLLVLVLMIIVVSVCPASDWYVCLGSFHSFENAQKVYKTLNSENIPVNISQAEKNGNTLYRIIYNEPAASREDAHKILDKIKDNPSIKKISPSGLWVCEANPMYLTEEKKETADNEQLKKEIAEGNAHFIENKKIVLTQNQQSIPIDEETPYSVLVNSYKEEQPANRDMARLSEKNIDSYIVKTYTPSDLFSFDLHSGAFKTEDEAYDLMDKIEDLGIVTTGEVSDYNEIKSKIDEYETQIKEVPVFFDTGVVKVSDSISPKVLKTIKQFPINRNYQVNEIYILDFEVHDFSKLDSTHIDINKEIVNNMLSDFDEFIPISEVEAVSIASYEDVLFEKKMNVLVASIKEDSMTLSLDTLNEFLEDFEEDVKTTEFQSKGIKWASYYMENYGDYYLYGTNKDNSLISYIYFEDFSQEEFEVFLNDIDNDGDLLIYPQVRKSLSILPKGESGNDIKMFCYKFSKVGEDYAESKDYALWAEQIVGHWNSEVNLNIDEKPVLIGFFDMDYDFNAKKVYDQFKEEHENSTISSRNHSCSINQPEDAWFVDTFFGQEVSFSHDSFIIAVDSVTNSPIDENKLIEISKDLQIWEK